MGKGTQTCLPLRGSGGGCSAVPGVWPPVPSTRSQRVRVGKAGEPGPGPRRPPLSLLFAAPVPALASSSLLSPLTEQPRPMATSFLLTPAPVPVDPRLGISREMRMGWDEGVWDQDPRNKTCCSAHLLLCFPLSSLLPSPHCLCFPFCLVGALSSSQELPACPLDSWHFAVSQIL